MDIQFVGVNMKAKANAALYWRLSLFLASSIIPRIERINEKIDLSWF